MALAVLDHFLYTRNAEALARYLPLATATADFFRQHYHNRTAQGKYLIWPTQALETWWCEWDTARDRPQDNCCQNDMPTVAGLYSLLQKLLALPAGTVTAAQRAEWQTFLGELPPLPKSADGKMLSPAAVLSSGKHNSETPELYAVHPYRLYTVGTNHTRGTDLSPALASFVADPLAHSNGGWNQGVMNAALLGMAEVAGAMVLQRAQTGGRVHGVRGCEACTQCSYPHHLHAMLHGAA